MIDPESQHLQREAYEHGRTQERLRVAVESLRRIKELSQSATLMRRRDRARLMVIRTECELTLDRLSRSTGGVIDDVAPLSPEKTEESK